MNITVKGDRLIFRSKFKHQIDALLTKHLLALPVYLLKIREDKPNDSCWLDFNFRCAVTPNDSTVDLEHAFTSFLDAVGPYLSNAARLEVTNQDGRTSTEFTGLDSASTDELGISELGSLALNGLSQAGAALTPGGADLIEEIKSLSRSLTYREQIAPEASDQTRSYAVFVLATNAEGNPAMLTTNVLATDRQYRGGQHYAVAEQRARRKGYTQTSSFDENDPAARAISRENCCTLSAEDDQLVEEVGEVEEVKEEAPEATQHP